MQKLQSFNSKMTLRPSEKKGRRKNRLGYSLIEVTIVMAIVAVALAAVLVAYQQVVGNMNNAALIRQSNKIVTQVVAMHQFRGEYPKEPLTSGVVTRGNWRDTDISYKNKTNETALLSPFNTLIWVNGLGGRNFTVFYSDLPADACVSVLDQYVNTSTPLAGVKVENVAIVMPLDGGKIDKACKKVGTNKTFTVEIKH